MSRVLSASGPLTRNFSGQPTGGPSLERRDAAHDVVEAGRQRLLQPLDDRLPDGMALGDDHRLGEEVVGELRVERQVEAHRALADIEAPMVDVGIGLEQRLDAVDGLLRRLDRSGARQRQVDHHFRPVGLREELLRHEAHGERPTARTVPPCRPAPAISCALRGRAWRGSRARSANCHGRHGP